MDIILKRIFKKIAYIVVLLSVSFLLATFISPVISYSKNEVLVSGKVLDFNGETAAYREIIYSNGKMVRFQMVSTEYEEMFTVKKKFGYTMSGGDFDPLNPTVTVVDLTKDGDGKIIRYYFECGKIICKQVIDCDLSGVVCITSYGNDGKELFTYTPSIENDGRILQFCDTTRITEYSKDDELIRDITFNGNDGTVLCCEKYVYDDDGLYLGRVKLDSEDNVTEFILDGYIYEYKDMHTKTVNLIDYDSVNYGSKTYINGYLTD